MKEEHKELGNKLTVAKRENSNALASLKNVEAVETTKAVERASYECGVKDTEIRLAEEVAGVCRDYCTKTWIETLNSAGIPANSELRKAESIFFPEHIRKAPADFPSTAQPLPPKQVSSIQDPTLDTEASIGAGKGKEVLPSTKDTQSEDALTIKDVIS